jgi:hypothetical protein
LEHKFITYIRTLQFWELRLKGKNPYDFVFFSLKKAKERFNISDTDLQKFISQKEIEIQETDSGKGYTYKRFKVLVSGPIDLQLIERKSKPLTPLTNKMKMYLNEVSLPLNSECSLYFEAFLKYRKYNLDLFFSVDLFSNRVHTPVTNLKSEIREKLLLKGEKTISLDVCTMQPLLLGKILNNQIGENDFSNWINSGNDIYLMLKEKANLSNRKEAKEKFFQILFSKPNQNLSQIFGGANWIEWVNKLKSVKIESNPNTNEKEHSNLAWLLQTTEVKLMEKVWSLLINRNIPFLSVHDEIIVRYSDYQKAKEIIESVLRNEFVYYKLNSKNEIFSENIELPKEQINLTVLEPETKEPPTKTRNSERKMFQYVSENKESWCTQISELETYFSELKVIGPVRLNKCSIITNVPLFVESHLSIIKANNGNKTFLPANQ